MIIMTMSMTMDEKSDDYDDDNTGHYKMAIC